MQGLRTLAVLTFQEINPINSASKLMITSLLSLPVHSLTDYCEIAMKVSHFSVGIAGTGTGFQYYRATKYTIGNNFEDLEQTGYYSPRTGHTAR